MSNVKPTTYRVYLGEDDTALLKEICQHTELGQEEILKKIAIAGIRAIMHNDRRVTFPLRFSIEQPESAPLLMLRDQLKPGAKK